MTTARHVTRRLVSHRAAIVCQSVNLLPVEAHLIRIYNGSSVLKTSRIVQHSVLLVYSPYKLWPVRHRKTGSLIGFYDAKQFAVSSRAGSRIANSRRQVKLL